MKVLFLIMDGLGDLPNQVLDKKTPLEFAKAHYFKKLAKDGETGLMTTIDYGVVPGSDTAHLALFGYDPKEWYLGRGVYEALGAGIELREGDLALRANVATFKNGKILDRRAGRNGFGVKELFKEINGLEIDGVKIIAKHTVEHRGVIVLRGKDLSKEIVGNDPHKIGKIKDFEIKKGLKGKEKEKALFTIDVLRKLIETVNKKWENNSINKEREKKGLKKVNYLLLRGPGLLSKKPLSFEKKWGLKAACIAGGALYKGVAKFLGFNIYDVPGATGDTHTNLENKVKYAIEARENFVFLHIKATDSLGHDGKALEKARFIEKVDNVLKKFEIHKEFDLIFVSGDHSTPCVKREHSSDPVPLLFYGVNTRKDLGNFTETEAALGTYRVKALDILPIILDKLELAKKYGA